MKNLLDTLIDEGLLDDLEDSMAEGDKMIDEDINKKWFTNDKCRMWKQKKGWVLSGNFKMTYDKEVYDGPKIRRVQGNFAVYDTNLLTLENIFTDDAEIEGTVTIEDNKNLVSLKGLPTTLKTITISGNKKLNDIDVMLNISGNAYISKNGKKFSKDMLAKKMNVSKNIFCSNDEDEKVLVESETLMEAFKAPQLRLIWKTLKEASKEVDNEIKPAFTDITKIKWDKLDASNISELDIDDPNCAKMIRAFSSGKINGVIFTMNKKGEPLKMFRNKFVSVIHPDLREYNCRFNRYNDKHKFTTYDFNRQSINTTEIIDALKEFHGTSDGKYEYLKPDTVMFIEIPLKLQQEFTAQKQERRNLQKGAVALMRGNERTGKQHNYGTGYNHNDIDYRQVRYFQRVADENRERYQQLIIKMRAAKAITTTTFTQLKERLDKAFERYTTLLDKVIKEPQKYTSYDIQSLHSRFYSVSSYSRWNNASGLFPSIEEYSKLIINASKGQGGLNINNKLKELEQTIKDKLKNVEDKLTSLE